MATLSATAVQTFPSGIGREAVSRLLEDTRAREAFLQQIIRRFEQVYGCSLEKLEQHLDRGEGSEHPDWEDSIEWRNAIELLQQTQIMRSILSWLANSIVPSRAS